MTIQIINYGAFLRLTMDSNVFLLAKAQIKSVEVIRDDTVRINNGEGPLQEILIKLSEVTQPAGLVDVAALRDTIARMLDTGNQYEVEALVKMQAQIDELAAIKQLFNLWHSSLQIDMNYQQLQVNALVSIIEKLQKAQEDNEKIIESLEEQTDEMQEQTQKFILIETVLSASKTVQDAILTAATAQAAQLSAHTTAFTEIITGMETQTGLLTDMKGLLNDIKTNTTPTP
jgi:myosin heavy subunit